MYLDNSIKNYLDDLAARKPAPGGGSASALSAATGVSLMLMVVNYTIGKNEYKDSQEKCREIAETLEGARKKLQDLIDEDVEAYNKLSEGMKKYEKNSPELDPIFKGAADVPFKICEIAGECLELCKGLAELGNKNLITDTAIAAIMLEGAFLSAKFNVYINLKFIKDMQYIDKVHKRLSSLESKIPKLKEEILHRCEEVIR